MKNLKEYKYLISFVLIAVLYYAFFMYPKQKENKYGECINACEESQPCLEQGVKNGMITCLSKGDITPCNKVCVEKYK